MTTYEYDLIVVGGGPAGLSAAINGASEGMKVVLLDSALELGGQAKESSAIENYAGFDTSIRGEELMARFVRQAQKFNSDFHCPVEAFELMVDGNNRIIITKDYDEYVAPTVILSIGLNWRRHNAKGLGALMGRGVHYGLPAVTSRLIGCTVIVVGGANSAGQAALRLSTVKRIQVKIMARSQIEKSMSQYLINRIVDTPNIEIIEGAEILKVSGHKILEEVVYMKDGSVERIQAQCLFFFIGAIPQTIWLRHTLLLDDHRFILTGNELPVVEKVRQPLAYETSVPGVFAAGDVRCGSVKRLGVAVGEGSGTLQIVHTYRRIIEAE